MTADDPKSQAKFLVDSFLADDGQGAFVNIKRGMVAAGLNDRVDKPYLINQGQASLCSPAALVYGLAIHKPVEYVTLVTELYNKGEGSLGRWRLKPSRDLKNYNLPPESSVDPSDWIPLASIRDCGNWFFDYESYSDDGVTTAGETMSWMKKAGFQKFESDCSSTQTKGLTNLQTASGLFAKDYNVMLRINAAVLDMCTDSTTKKAICTAPKIDPSQTGSNHRVALASGVTVSGTGVTLKIYSYGDEFNFNNISQTTFLNYYYGYIACLY